MKNTKSLGRIIASHTFTYFNFLNLMLAFLVILSGQYKNMLFLGIVVSNTLIGIIQEWKVKKLIDQLSVVTATHAKRQTPQGEEEVLVEELGVGDRIRLLPGDQIPVDCTVVQNNEMEVNESLLTGESLSVEKKEGDFLYSGSHVVAGSAVVEVLHIGADNYASQIVHQARGKRRATSEMQDAIKRIIKYVSFAIVPIGIVLYYIQRVQAGNDISDSLVNTVAGVLGMIPEGLVLLTSVSFILGVGRLARKNALVQEMEAIEALARVEVLCLDKTGTITTGELCVEEVLDLQGGKEEKIHEIISALAYAFEETNATSEALRQYFPEKNLENVVNKVPFSSERKYMGITLGSEKEITYCLGAPEYLTQEESVLEKVEQYAAKGMRVLLLTEEDKPLGAVVISDIIKEDAPETFRFFEEKGVQLKVISGDNPLTVSKIAKRAGLKEAERYVDARELPDDLELLQEEVANYHIYGRVSPEKKQKIVQALERQGYITGMVGDGVNDVLALKEADCGIAMAKGSDAAKQTAHIVLLDSNFASMKHIVGEGRTIISNIERVSALYLTKTIYSVLLCVFFIILRKSYPFIPIQLSLMGGMAIGAPSFILALEKHEDTIPSGFVKNVLKVSLPAAIAMTVGALLIRQMGDAVAAKEIVISTLNLLLGGFVSFGVLLRVCKPMSKLRAALCIAMILGFLGAILLFPGFFGILPLREMI